MAKRLILIDVGPGETRIAILEDGRLAALAFERAPPDLPECAGQGTGARLGDIVLGRVKRILSGMDAAFVDIGQPRNGFLSAKHIPPRCGIEREGMPAPGIRSLVQEGQAVIVQIIKDPIGDKGARLSLSVSLPGRYLVLLPWQKTLALSHRIEDEGERERLTRILERIAEAETPGAGFAVGLIARGAAIGADEAQLAYEAKDLVRRWLGIIEIGKRAEPPAVIAREAPALMALLRDGVDTDTEAIIVNDVGTLAAMREDAAQLCTSLPPRLKLYSDPKPLFEAYGIVGDVEALESAEAPLPSGGWITFETTEALTAIDVNSGRFSARSLEETGFTTNLEAATEIGRQLRLREIGGLIIVDFIHMDDPAHIAAVEEALAKALVCDRTPTQTTPMSVFGVIEITRKRVREPLSRLFHTPCAHCDGSGLTASIATRANEALRGLCRESATKTAGHALRLMTAPDVAAWLTARQGSVLEPLSARLCRPLTVEGDARLALPHYRIEEDA